MRTVNATPKASMLIESMRDIGYSLETALADVIDNSIAAGASRVDIFAEPIGAEFKIAIMDNGKGMSEKQLIIAMRPGSRNPLEERRGSDLGRFGLGLKTASFSQCRRLTVASRKQGIATIAVWDLDRVAREDEWIVELPEDLKSVEWGDKLNHNGTLVVWENLDRLIDSSDFKASSTTFARRLDDAITHLELVFHRYLSGEQGLKKLLILLNGRPLKSYDPFQSGHPSTIKQPAEPEIIGVGDYEVAIQTFTLPHHRKVSSAEWERNSGPGGYLKNQGFYIYRERRLIIHDTWFGLARQTELTKLTRVRIDIPNGLDAEWKIDVKKASAQPPPIVRDRLRRLIETIGATSKRVYSSRGHRLTNGSRLPVWNRYQSRGDTVYHVSPEHPVIQGFQTKLPGDLRIDFLEILELIGSALPVEALFADLHGETEKVRGNRLSEDSLRHSLKKIFDCLRSQDVALEEILEMLRGAETFGDDWQLTERIVGELTVKELPHV